MHLHSKAKQSSDSQVTNSPPDDRSISRGSNVKARYDPPLGDVDESVREIIPSQQFESPARSLRCSLGTKRWNVVETYERDGDQYMVARREKIRRFASPALSRREHQALSLAAFGLSNKEIAYQMGIGASTVGVFIHRAAEKIGCANVRAELLDHFRRLSSRAPASASCG
jgi:DNA-binding CsgD family transcriptional regulator